MNPNKSTHGWILCPSKSFPGKFYYFNVTSGDTAWSLNDTESKTLKQDGNIHSLADKSHSYPEPALPPRDFSNNISANVCQPTRSVSNTYLPNIPQSQTFGQAVFPKYVSNVVASNIVWAPMLVANEIRKPTSDQITQTCDLERHILVQSCDQPLFKRFTNYEETTISSNDKNEVKDKNVFNKFYETSTPKKERSTDIFFGNPKIIPRNVSSKDGIKSLEDLQKSIQHSVPLNDVRSFRNFESNFQINSKKNNLKVFGSSEKQNASNNQISFMPVTNVMQQNVSNKKEVGIITSLPTPSGTLVGSLDVPIIKNKSNLVKEGSVKPSGKMLINEPKLKIKHNCNQVSPSSFVHKVDIPINPHLDEQSMTKNQPNLTLIDSQKPALSPSNKTDITKSNTDQEDLDLESDDLRYLLVAKRRKSVDEPTIGMKTTHKNETIKKKVAFQLDCENSNGASESLTDDTQQVAADDNSNIAYLKGAQASESWYILADAQILLEKFDFIEEYLGSDEKCKLLVPHAVRWEIESTCVGDCGGRRNVIAARQLARLFASRPQHIVVQSKSSENINSIFLADNIIDCGLEAMRTHQYHVILITNDSLLRAKAINKGLPTCQLQEIIDSFKLRNEVTFELKDLKVSINNDIHENLFLSNPSDFNSYLQEDRLDIAVNCYKKNLFDKSVDQPEKPNTVDSTTSPINFDDKLINITKPKSSKDVKRQNEKEKNHYDSDIDTTFEIGHVIQKINLKDHEPLQRNIPKNILEVETISTHKSNLNDTKQFASIKKTFHVQNDIAPVFHIQNDEAQLFHTQNDNTQVYNFQNDKARVFHVQNDKAPVFHVQNDKAQVFHVQNDKAQVFHNQNDKAPVFHVQNDKAQVFHNQNDKAPVFHVQNDKVQVFHNQNDKAPVFHIQNNKTQVFHNQNDDAQVYNFQNDKARVFHIQNDKARVFHIQNDKTPGFHVQNDNAPVFHIGNEKALAFQVQNNKTPVFHVRNDTTPLFHIQNDSRGKFQNENNKYCIIDKNMEMKLTTGMDEWICRLTQIMEDTLSELLRKSAQEYNRPPPWSLTEVVELVIDTFNQPTIKNIANKLSLMLLKFRNEGTMKSRLQASDFMELLRLSTCLVQALKEVFPNKEALIDAEKALDLLLHIIINPEPIECEKIRTPVLSKSDLVDSTQDRRNFVKPTSEIIKYLGDHFVEWRGVNERKMVANKNEGNNADTKVVRTFGKNLSHIKIHHTNTISIEDHKKTENNTKDVENKIENVLDDLNIPKRVHTLEVNEREQPKVISNFQNIDILSLKKTNRCEMKEVDLNLNFVTHGNTFDQETGAGPKIIRNLTRIDAFEDKLENKSLDFDLDKLDYEIDATLSSIDYDDLSLTKGIINDNKTLANDNYEVTNNLTKKGDNINETHNDKLALDNDANDQSFAESPLSSLSLINDKLSLNNECMTNDSGFESLQASSLVKNFLTEMSLSFKMVYNFINGSLRELRNDLHDDNKKILIGKIIEIHFHLANIISKLTSIIQRESNGGCTAKELLIRSGEFDNNDKRLTRYRQVVMKCLEQAQMLLNGLDVMRAVTCNDFDALPAYQLEDNTTYVKFFNIFE